MRYSDDGTAEMYHRGCMAYHDDMVHQERKMKQSDLDILTDLNRNYVRSVEQGDVQWFEQHLADDFMNSNPDGSLVDRSAFLRQVARGSTVSNIKENDVRVRILGDYAIIHARTTYRKSDGTDGSGRYTDDWHKRNGVWLCVSAHVGRS
jgi:ketosteroid isomerase-like protein